MNKELFVTSTPHETKVAMTEDDSLAEIYLERENEYILAGSVYKGRVTRVLPGMQSAFVDIGLERDAFLYVSDFFEMEEEDEDLEEAVAKGTPILQASIASDAGSFTEVEEDFGDEPEGGEELAVEDDGSVEVVEEVEATGAAPSGEAGNRDARGRRRRRGRRGRFGDRPARTEGGEAAAAPERTESEHFLPAPSAPIPSFQPIILPGESLSKYKQASAPVEAPAPVAHEAKPEGKTEAKPEAKHDEPVATVTEAALVKSEEAPAPRPRRAVPSYAPIVLPGESLAKYRRAQITEPPAAAEPVPEPQAPVAEAAPAVEPVAEPVVEPVPEPVVEAAAPVAEPEAEIEHEAEAQVRASAPIARYVVAEPEPEPVAEPEAVAAPARRAYEAPQVEVHAGAPEGTGHEVAAEDPQPEPEAVVEPQQVAQPEPVAAAPEAVAEPAVVEEQAAPAAAPVAPSFEVMEFDEEEDEPHFSELASALPPDVSVTDFAEQRAEAEREQARILPGHNMTEEEIDEEEAELRAYGLDLEDIGFDEFEEEVKEADGFVRGAKAEVLDEEDEDEFDEEEVDDEADEAQEEAERLASGDYDPATAEPRAPGRQQRARRSGRPDRGDRNGQRRRFGRNSGAPRRSMGRRDSGPRPLISDLLKEGQEIIVQIAKEPIGKKGARITSHIALPGRFLVYMPTVNHVGVSRKIASDEERLRLKRIVVSERENGTGGFIVRTAAQNAPEEELRADIRFLKNLWVEMKQRAESRKPPALIYHDLNVVERVLRDQVTRDFTTIWVDTEVEYERVLRFAQRFQPSLVKRIKLWSKSTPLFDQFGLTEEFNKALKAKVWLKNGGYIVINQTEALVAIDVNTGKYVGKTARLEDTITKTNIEACAEIVRQIRLRDLGGIIILDFIDMDERRNRQKVMQALEEAMKNDRAPSKILQFNDFGLVAITRKRVKQSLERTVGTSCEYCAGTGFVKSVTTVCNEIYVEMRKIAHQLKGGDVMLRVHPEVGKMLKTNNGRWIQELEELTRRTVIVKNDPLLHQEQFDIN